MGRYNGTRNTTKIRGVGFGNVARAVRISTKGAESAIWGQNTPNGRSVVADKNPPVSSDVFEFPRILGHIAGAVV